MPTISELVIWLESLRAEHGDAEFAIFVPEHGHADPRILQQEIIHEREQTVILLIPTKPVRR